MARYYRYADDNRGLAFFTSGKTGSEAENSPTSNVVYTAHAEVRRHPNKHLFYRLDANVADNNYFTINATTGAVTFKASPDYEGAHGNAYSIVVTAYDGRPRHTVKQAVTITVTDVNDNAPVFTSGTTATTAENVATTTTVYTAHANDADGTSPNKTVHYSLAANVGDNNLFNIDANTGAVTFKASPDYEHPADAGANNVYDVTVTATDGGTPAKSTTQTVHITVTDANDNAPAFASATASASEAENTPASNVVYTAHATDADGTSPNNSVTYSLSGTDAGKFNINATSGAVTFKAAPDYEAHPTPYQITVVATDGGNPALSSSQAVTITVTDVNDNAPVFTSSATPTVNEGTTAVVTLTTTDADTVGNNPPTFTITGGADAAQFQIVNGNQLEFITAKDYETQAHSYQVQVTANDGANTTTQSLTVGVADVAPSAPTDVNNADNHIAAGSAQGSPTGITASSTDPAGGTVTYSLTNDDSGHFQIDSNGVVTAGPVPLTYDSANPANNTRTITVQAADPSNATSTHSFTITVDPDAPPVVTAGHTLAYAENQAATAIDPAITVTDSDSPNLAGATVQITGNYVSGQDLFGFTDTATIHSTFDATTGTLTLSGTDTVANYQAALQAVSYQNTSDNPSGAARTVTIIANDGIVGSNHATDTINVTPINDAPTATNLTQSLTIDEDAAATHLFTAAPTVADVDSPTVTATLTLADSSAGVLTGATATATPGVYTITGSPQAVQTALAAVNFDSADNYNGATSVAVTIDDGGNGPQGTNPTGTVSITVNAVNDAPTATGLTQSLTIDEDAAATNLFTTAPTVADVDSPTVTATLTLTEATAGVLTGAGAGTASGGGTVYTISGSPQAVQTALAAVQLDSADNYNGMTSVTVAITDGQNGPQGTNPSGTVSITVNAVNDAPTATNLTQSLTIDEDAAATTLFTTAPTVSDIDSPTVTATLTLSAAAGVLTGAGTATASGGNLVYKITDTPANVSTALAAVKFDSADNYNGMTSVAVAVDDGHNGPQGTNPTGTVSITVNPVNDAPTATNLTQSLTINEDAAATTLFTTAPTVSDVDSPTVTATLTVSAAAGVLTGAGTATASGGNLVYTIADTPANVSAALAAVKFDSADNYNGMTSVAVAITDGQNGPQGTNPSGTVSITINSVNDAPSGADKTISGAGPHTFTVADFGFSDPVDAAGPSGANSLLAVEITTLPATGSLTDNGNAVTAGQFISVADITGGHLVFTPSGGPETVTFTFQVQDDGGTAHGGVDLDPTPNTITLSPNAPPVIDSNGGGDTASVSVAENTTAVTTVHATDPDNQPSPITYSIVGGADQTKFTINQTSGALSFIAAPDYETPQGSVNGGEGYVVQVAASDGASSDTQTITVTVTDVNEPPTAHPDAVSATEAGVTAGVNPTFNVIAGTGETITTGADTDPDAGDNLTVQGVVAGSTNAAQTSGANADVNGTYGKIHINSDGTATYTVDNTNSTVQALNASSAPLTDTFSYTIKDSANHTSTTQVTVTIDGQNDAPTNTVPAATQTTNEDTPKQITGVSVADVDSTALTTTLSVLHGSVSVTTGRGATISNNGTGTVTVAGTAAQINTALAGLIYTNTPDYNGADTLTVSTSDGSATTANTVAISVTPVADIMDDSATTTTNTPVNINVNANDTFENPGHTITAINSSSIATNGSVAVGHGSVTLLGDGTLTYTPTTGYSGGDGFTYTVTSGGVTETANVTVTVNPPNRPPTATSATATTNEDTNKAITLSATDPDAGDSVANYKLTSLPSATVGTLYLADGTTLAQTNTAYTSNSFVFKPVANYSGTTSFNFTATDTHGATSSTATETIDISPVADQAGTPAFGDFTPTAATSQFTISPPSGQNLGVPAVSAISGGYVVAYSDFKTDYSVGDIVAQRYDFSGNAVGTPIHVSNNIATNGSILLDDQANVEKLPNGGFLVAWTRSLDVQNNTQSVVVKLFDANGNATSGEITVANGSGNSSTGKSYSNASATVLSDGKFVVMYQAQPYGGNGITGGAVTNVHNDDFYGQLYSAAGAPIGTAFHPTAVNDGNGQFAPHVTALSDGGFLVDWTETTDTSSSNFYYSIKAQRYNAQGQTVNADGSSPGGGQTFTIDTNTSEQSSVAALSSGGWVVAWVTGSDIHYRVYGANGVGGTANVANTVTTDNQDTPDVTALPDGGFVISWLSPTNDNDIYAQRFDAAGHMVGTQVTIVSANGSQVQYADGLAVLGNGDFASVWADTAGAPVKGILFADPGDGGAGLVTTLTTLNTTPSSDPSETFSYHITGFAAGTTFNKGSLVGSEWVISDPSDITYLKTHPLTMNSPTAGTFTLTIDAQEADTATLSTGPVTSTSHSTTTLVVGIKAAGDPVFAAHDAGTFDLHLSPITEGNTAHVEALPDDGLITYADGTAVKAGATLSAHDLAGLKFTPLDDGADHAANLVYSVSDGTSVDTQALPIYVLHGSGLTVTGTPDKDVLVGGAGADTLIGNGGGNFLTGGGGADTFVFEAKALADAQAAAPVTDHVTDYSAAQGDILDFTALFASTPNPSAQAASLVHVTEESSGTAASVSVNVAGPNAAAHWVEIAHLDGVQAGQTVDVTLDAAHPHQVSHIHVDGLAHA